MTVTVVIPHYFAVREVNLPVIADALLNGTHPPEQILIWNNDAPLSVSLPPSVAVVQSPRNVGCKARFLAGLMAETDLIVFHDNDVVCRPDTIGNLRHWHQKLPDALLSLDGRLQTTGEEYRRWQRVRRVQAPVAVDMSLGRLEMVPRAFLPRILSRIPFDASTVMDDLWFSFAAMACGVRIVVIPTSGQSDIRDLPTGCVGLSVQEKPAYYAARQQACDAIRKALTI